MRTVKLAQVEVVRVEGDKALVVVDGRLEVWVSLRALAHSGVDYVGISGKTRHLTVYEADKTQYSR